MNWRHDYLRKDLGQHFLTRSDLCAPLVGFLAPRGRSVVEIGPGSGALTEALLDEGARVLAWELDPRWALHVRRRFAGLPLTTVVGDATELPWDRVPEGSLVAGNLPYNVATRIILQMLESTVGREDAIERASFLVQREVAKRLAASPGEAAYGSLSVLVGALARVDQLGVLPPGAFRPPPKVVSGFVGLTPGDHDFDLPHWTRFVELVRGAFAQRRKTLRNSLGSSLGMARAEALLGAAGVESSIRAESLATADFRRLLECWLTLEPLSGEGPPTAGSVQ